MAEAPSIFIEDIDFGAADWRSIHEAFSTYNINPPRGTLEEIRGGRAPRSRLEYTIACITANQTQDVSPKDVLYHLVLARTLMLREVQPRKPYRFSSHGLILAVAQDLQSMEKGIKAPNINQGYNGMRLDFLSVLASGKPDPTLLPVFHQNVELFLGHQKHKNGNKSANMWREFDETWDRKPNTFYQFIKLSRQLVASWVPYESAVLEYFYRRRLLMKSPGVTPFDQDCLNIFKANTNPEMAADNHKLDYDLLEQLFTKYPFTIRAQDFFTHTQAIAHGTFTKKLRAYYPKSA